MKERTYIGNEDIFCDSGEVAHLHYYLIRESYNGCESYGTEIAMLRNGLWSSAMVRHVTTSPERMLAIIERLQRSTVTPCSLQDIILDEINKY